MRHLDGPPDDLMAALHRLRDQVFLAIDEVGTTGRLGQVGFNRMGDAYSAVFMTLQRQAQAPE